MNNLLLLILKKKTKTTTATTKTKQNKTKKKQTNKQTKYHESRHQSYVFHYLVKATVNVDFDFNSLVTIRVKNEM